jgi:phytoene dehydrogenase-like protein
VADRRVRGGLRAREPGSRALSVLDAVVIGSGPNGLAAAVALAREGAGVLVLEADDEIGGGTRSAELTLPGFLHDVCSAVHPMGILSPFFRELPLEAHGLTWVRPPASVAHPMPQGEAVMLYRSFERTAERLGRDAAAWRRLVLPFVSRAHDLLADAMAPLRVPSHPLVMARFGMRAAFSANRLARLCFREAPARALFAGCAGHAILPLTTPLTAALGLMFAITAHVEDWPVARGGSRQISRALASLLRSLGGRVETGRRVERLADVPPSRVVLFDTSPEQLARIAADALPAGYRRRLARYRYGPGVFKLDWALDGPIPWSDPACLEASTVHVGGTLEEIAASERDMYRGRHAERPYLILCQQSQFDPTRAPAGKHTGYAYCHVPHGSTVDMTGAIEAQIERFAPGFSDRILARHAMSPAWLERHNPNYKGGAITGGVADAFQLWTRPVARLDPYSTPNPRLFLCSAATPPGGGVHGQCGFWAARSALRRLGGVDRPLR